MSDPLIIAPRFLKTGAAARYIGLGRTAFMDRVRAGEIPCLRDRRHLLFLIADLDAYIAALPRGYVAGPTPGVRS